MAEDRRKIRKGSGRSRLSIPETRLELGTGLYSCETDEAQEETTNIDRDRFLVEAMGWKHWNSIGDDHYYISTDIASRDPELLPSFSTWVGYGLLWEWAERQEWFSELFCEAGGGDLGIKEFEGALLLVDSRHIRPARFATIIYEFLKEKEVGS